MKLGGNLMLTAVIVKSILIPLGIFLSTQGATVYNLPNVILLSIQVYHFMGEGLLLKIA